MRLSVVLVAAMAVTATAALAACGAGSVSPSAPRSSPPGQVVPAASGQATAVTGDCLFGANGNDVQVGIANPTQSCSTWVQALAGSGLNWYPIDQLVSLGGAGTADQETMGEACDLTDGTQELYVEDAGDMLDGNSICSSEEQNGWSPEGTPGPLAAQAQQQQQTNVQSSASAAQASASAAASASQAAADAAAEQQAQSAVNGLQSLSFQSDLQKLSSDMTTTANDLATEKTAAAQGQDGPGNEPGSCYNLTSNVSYDAQNDVGYDAQNDFGYDLSYTFVPDISSARQAISAAQSDVSQLQNAGLPIPSVAATAISSAQAVVRSAVTTANQDVATENGYVNTAYSIANNMATGNCAGDGPGSPSLVATIS